MQEAFFSSNTDGGFWRCLDVHVPFRFVFPSLPGAHRGSHLFMLMKFQRIMKLRACEKGNFDPVSTQNKQRDG